MSNVITKRVRLSRRTFLKGATLAGSPISVGLPPLVSMFNSNGAAYAAETGRGKTDAPIESRFVLWFNGNGIPERYWIPVENGPDYRLPPCLAPLTPIRENVHVVTGLDNAGAGSGGHMPAMAALMTGTQYTGRGASSASIDQLIAKRIGGESRFHSLQLGVSQESFGSSMQRNMSWSGYERPLPPEMIPHRLFDRLFGRHEEAWLNRKRSILDVIKADAGALKKNLAKEDLARVDEHLAAVRDLERQILSLPPDYHKIDPPEAEDMKDWPKIAKLQSDMLAYAFSTRQTRVASYMLTKCQGIARFPWLGFTAARHHDYTHADGLAPGSGGAEGQRILREICRWHVEEFAYLVSKLESIPEGDGTLFDHTTLIFVHEHAEANPHKNNGLAMIVAGGSPKLARGSHTKVEGTVGDAYVTVADEVVGAGIGKFPTATKRIRSILA